MMNNNSLSLTPEGDSEAIRIVRKYEYLKSKRENWESLWDDVTKYTHPNNASIYSEMTTGNSKNHRLYDSTAIHASKMLASYLDGSYTPRSGNWFMLTSGEMSVDTSRPVFEFLQGAVRTIAQSLHRSNFYTEMYEVYHDLTTIGTTTLRVEDDEETDVRFYHDLIWSWIIDENHRGVVDTAIRKLSMTIRNIVNMFGMDILQGRPDLQQIYELEPLMKFDLLHCIEPDQDSKKKFRSTYVFISKQFVLRSAKFNEWPVAVPRFYKADNEIYGRSPSIDALPDIKQVNGLKKFWLRSVQKVVDPPLMVPDQGFMLPLKTVPASVNIYRAGIKDRIEQLPTGNPLLSMDIIQSLQEDIKKAYFTDRLQLPQIDRMTATETVRRSEENDSLMSPIIARLDNELLKVIIKRTYGILLRKGKLGEEPEELKGKDLDIKFISPVAKSQRFTEAITLSKVVETSAVAIQAQPNVMDNIDGDAVLRFNAELYGLPYEMFRTPEQVEQLRKERAEQEQAMQQAQLQNMQADTMQKTAKSQGL